MKQPSQQAYQSQYHKKGNHLEYFKNLENKLLAESQKLTQFMDKALFMEKSSKSLKLSLSPTQTLSQTGQLNPSVRFSGRLSLKNQQSLFDSTSLKRVKDLCMKLKSRGIDTEPTMKPAKDKSSKQKYENYRKVLYNVCSKEQVSKDRILNIAAELEKVERIKKHMKVLTQIQSLKETVSTQECKSTRIMNQQGPPFIAQNNLKLEDFDIIKPIGQGKLGTVSLVRHKKTHLLFALKKIPHNILCADQKMLVQRIRQIKIHSFLDHPNIVQLYSVFIENGDLYMLMQLCFDGNLYQHLRILGKFPEEKIRSIIKQVCHAIEYMHDNDILHRDLKPENILFHQNIVKICDFGWAVNSPLLRNTLCGSPLYSSPEIAKKQQYDNKVDIWNIGILTYELAYGRVPFEIRNQEDILKVVEQDIYFPRSQPASPQIKDFISRCLFKDPKERFTIAKLIDHQFLNPQGDDKKLI